MNIKNWIYILFFNISCSGLLFGMDPSLYQSSLSQSSLSQSSLPKSPFEQSEREGSIRGFSASQGNVPTKTWATSMLESAYNTIFSPQKTSVLPISTFYEEESDRSRQKAFSFDTFQTLVFNITDKDLYKVITFPSFKRNEIIGIVKKNLTILQDYIKEYHKPESARINYLEEVKTDIDALGKKIQDQSIDLKERLEEIASFRNKILAVSFVTQESDLAASFIDLATSGSLQTSTIAIKNEVRALENQWPDDVGGRILYIFGKQDWSDDIKEAILQLLFFEYSNVKLGRKEKEEAKTREIKIAQGIDQPAPPTAAISLALEALNKQAAAIIANPGEPKQLVGLEGFIEKVANLPDEQASGLKEWFNNFIEKQGKGLPTIKEVIAALQAKKTMQEEQLKREKEEREIGVEASDFSELETAFIGSDEPSASIPLPILELKDKYLLNAYKLIYDYEINKAQDKLEAAIKLWYKNRASGRFTPDAHHMQLPLAQYSSNTKQIKEDIARDYSNQFVGRNKKLYQEISKLIILLLENSSPDKQELVKADIISLVDYLNPGHQGFNSTRESIKFLVRKINQNNIEDITKACFVLLSDISEFQPIINNINRVAYTKNRDALYGLGLKKSLNDKEEKDFNGLIKNLNDIYNYSNLAFELRKQQQLHIGASKILDVGSGVVQGPLLEEGQSSIQPTEWKMEVRRSTSGLPEEEMPQKTTKKQSGSEIISSLTQVPKDLPATKSIPETKKEEELKLEQPQISPEDKVKAISSILPAQIEDKIINPILSNQIDMENTFLRELDAYEKQINIYKSSGGLAEKELLNAKAELNKVNSKRRKLMAESLESQRTGSRAETIEHNYFEFSLLNALNIPVTALYSNDKRDNLSEDSKSLVECIITMGENIDNIARKDTLYIQKISPYVLALGAHPFLDTDKISPDNSLMFANESLFDFKDQDGKQISFYLFEEACGTIANHISGFPIVPARKKVFVDAAPLPQKVTKSEPISPESITPQPSAASIPAPIYSTNVPARVAPGQQSTQQPSEVVAPASDVARGSSSIPVDQPAATPEEQPTGWLSWLFSPVTSLVNWVISSMQNLGQNLGKLIFG